MGRRMRSGPAAPPAAPPKVVFIGDSITYLWTEPNFGLSFWSMHSTWNDQGLIGENSWQLQQRFSADVVAQHPAVAHILIGTNDVFSVYSPPWQIDGGSPLYDTTDNIKHMVALAQAANIKVVLGTIPPYSCTDAAQCALAIHSEPSLPTH
jgi:lysophospholipase L1-like esterase